MKKNMGNADRIIRVILAVVLGLLVMNGAVSGLWAVILTIFALVFLLTSAVSSCPLYLPFGISTRGKDSGA